MYGKNRNYSVVLALSVLGSSWIHINRATNIVLSNVIKDF